MSRPSPQDENQYHDDYAKEPIGGGNPYWRCKHCKKSAPDINGSIRRHEPHCAYRQAHEAGQVYRPYG